MERDPTTYQVDQRLVAADPLDRDALIEHLLGDLLAIPSRIPRYVRIAEALERAIRDGVLPPGTVLPPEPELARRVGISRQPLNEALVDLARRGLVTRRRRVGTVVVGAPVDQPLDRLYSFMASLDDGRAGRVEHHLLGTRVTHDAAAAAILTGSPDAELFELDRRYDVGGEPFAIERLWLPRDLGERLPVARLASEVIYDLLQEFCDVAVTHADESLRLSILERSDAALLGLATGDAAFLIERTASATTGPVEVRRTIARGDRVRFRVRLPGFSASHERWSEFQPDPSGPPD